MGAKEKIQEFALNQVMNYLSSNPEKNFLKVLDWIDGIGLGQGYARHIQAFRDALNDPENIWFKYMMGVWRDIDNDIIKMLFRNFFLNACLTGSQKQIENEEKYGCHIPWAILMDPTSACNLKCTGCWAAEYGNKLNLPYETLDDIIRQGKELGTYFYLYSGGEPLVRKDDIIRLCDAHPDCEFAAFTNATLIDEAFADEMLRVKNFIPAISVEGFEEATDSRRGTGVYKRVERAMEILKERKLPFGISCCYTSKNAEVIGSEEYFDKMIEWGVKFVWLFTYMPVGRDAVPELMVSAEQRAFMLRQVRKFRASKPIFTLDFWNDGEYVNGCIAGGRQYIHINANGDVEPCAFIHYSDSNLKDKTILEALQSPLLMAYKHGQPFNDNHLRPCPLLDNPEKLMGMVDASGAYSTDLQNPEDVHDLAAKCDDAAKKWGAVADEIWKCSGCAGGCGK